MKPPNYAPVYAAALYPDLAELFRSHGYALACHGSLARDLRFDRDSVGRLNFGASRRVAQNHRTIRGETDRRVGGKKPRPSRANDQHRTRPMRDRSVVHVARQENQR